MLNPSLHALRATWAALATALVLSVGVSSAARQGTTAGTPVIVGQIVNGATGAPIAGAAIGADADNGRSPTISIVTDSNGRFALREISRWPVVLRASKPGYINGSFGQRYATHRFP